MIERAVNLIKRHGVDGVHSMLLKKSKFTDFMSICTKIIFALDRFEDHACEIPMKVAVEIINNSGLSARELLDLNEYLKCQSKKQAH